MNKVYVSISEFEKSTQAHYELCKEIGKPVSMDKAKEYAYFSCLMKPFVDNELWRLGEDLLTWIDEHELVILDDEEAALDKCYDPLGYVNHETGEYRIYGDTFGLPHDEED